MAWLDDDVIEEELDLIVPDVFRIFMDTAEAHRVPVWELGFYMNTQSLIDGNGRMRLNRDEWKDYYLAIGSGDGCGNYDFLLARSETDDAFCMIYHDPPGIAGRQLTSSAAPGKCSRETDGGNLQISQARFDGAPRWAAERRHGPSRIGACRLVSARRVRTPTWLRARGGSAPAPFA